MNVTAWQPHAACLEEDPELFFPVGHTNPAKHQAQEAKDVCSWCPVIEHCLQWALANGIEYGVLGGFTEDERRQIRRPPATRRAGGGSDPNRLELAADRRREILHLADYGISEPEIAHRLGMSEDYVHDLLRDLRKKAAA